jgi:hypothetical protein
LTFNWITPLLALGYARPLYDTDLYKLQDERASAAIAKKIVDDFERRRAFTDEYNARLRKGDVSPGLRAIWWKIRGNSASREQKWRETDGLKRPNLALAMNASVKWWFWSAGICRVYADTAQVTSPLLVKVCMVMHPVYASQFAFIAC